MHRVRLPYVKLLANIIRELIPAHSGNGTKYPTASN